MASSDSQSFLTRMQLVFSDRHQPLIAVLLLLCFAGTVSYFVYFSIVNRGLIDIDRTERLRANFKIDINSADWPEFVVLPGVGEKLARAIVEHRRQVGPFPDLESIQDVSGIGEGKLEQIKPFLLPIEEAGK